jgi:hypothetical protein
MPEELKALAKAKVKDRAKAIKIGLPTESP